MRGNEIIQGDCLDVMRTMPAESVDLIATDPPYGVSFVSNARKEKFKSIVGDDELGWVPDFIAESYRILKNDTHFYCFTRWDVYPYWYNEIKKHFDIKNLLVIKRRHWGMGDLEGAFAPGYELCIFAMKGRREFEKTTRKRSKSFNRDTRHSNRFVQRFADLITDIHPAEFNLDMKHPTQKTEAIMRFFIEVSTKPGELVLDPFVGSGTTCVAAKSLGREFIGIELDSDYVDIARNRLTQKGLEAFV